MGRTSGGRPRCQASLQSERLRCPSGRAIGATAWRPTANSISPSPPCICSGARPRPPPPPRRRFGSRARPPALPAPLVPAAAWRPSQWEGVASVTARGEAKQFGRAGHMPRSHRPEFSLRRLAWLFPKEVTVTARPQRAPRRRAGRGARNGGWGVGPRKKTGVGREGHAGRGATQGWRPLPGSGAVLGGFPLSGKLQRTVGAFGAAMGRQARVYIGAADGAVCVAALRIWGCAVCTQEEGTLQGRPLGALGARAAGCLPQRLEGPGGRALRREVHGRVWRGDGPAGGAPARAVLNAAHRTQSPVPILFSRQRPRAGSPAVFGAPPRSRAQRLRISAALPPGRGAARRGAAREVQASRRAAPGRLTRAARRWSSRRRRPCRRRTRPSGP
jgi:hypothetical protein